MTPRRHSAWKRRARELRNVLRDAAGLPVTFSDAEANRRKERLPDSAIRATRRFALSRVFGLSEAEIDGFVAEAQDLALDAERNRIERELRSIDSPMSTDDSFSLYAVIRAARPQVVVETGTAAGASARYILHALERNGGGFLHSVDLVDDPEAIGVMVPAAQRDHVKFHIGDSLKLLPEIFATHGPVDLFLHDSNHRYDHMRAEYELALGALGSGRVIASHDILHSNAWHHFLRRNRIARTAEIRNFGVCIVP